MINKKPISKRSRIAELQQLIDEWDRKSENNKDNKHNLSTSKRQDWVDELLDLKTY